LEIKGKIALAAIRMAAGMMLISTRAAIALGTIACQGGVESYWIGSIAPDFKLNNLGGQNVSLNSFGGKLVFLNFWSSTSSTCIKDRPVFQELSETWLDRNDVALLTINIGEEPETVKDFMESKKYTFPVLLDTQFEVASSFGVKYMPTSILIGEDREVKLNTIGEFKSVAAIEKQIAGFLN